MKTRPEFAENMSKYKVAYNEYYKDEEKIRYILPRYAKYDTKQIARLTHIEHYTIDISEYVKSGNVIKKDTFVLYDYLERNPINYQACIYEIEI